MKCPKCNKAELKTLYVRNELEAESGKRKRPYVTIGYVCKNPKCKYVSIDKDLIK